MFLAYLVDIERMSIKAPNIGAVVSCDSVVVIETKNLPVRQANWLK